MSEREPAASQPDGPQPELTAALADFGRPLQRIGLACSGMVLAAALSLTLAASGSLQLAMLAFVILVAYAACFVFDARRTTRRRIEALKAAMAAIQRESAQADAANRAKSVFLATMSHEIRTPLNAIVGYTSLLEQGVTGPMTPTQREYLARVTVSSDHLIRLIDDILDLSKVESGRMILGRESIAAQQSITGAVALIELQANSAGVEIETECPDASSFYVGDEDRVRQILVILLSNAVKFTDPGGKITVSCGTSTTPDKDATLVGDGPWTFIRVADTGIGISATEAETVFQPFVQADSGNTRKQGGAGLGLAIGLDLARRMGGDLTLRSAVGEGSCFTLWLPSTTEARDRGE
jgi:signal transduction histidine kinase